MVRLGRRKAPPAGWEEIEPVIRELELKMREGKLFLVHHQTHQRSSGSLIFNNFDIY